MFIFGTSVYQIHSAMRKIFLSIFTVILSFSAFAQAPNDKELTNMIQEQSYTFKLDFVIGLFGQKHFVANPSQYYLRVTPDSIICFLPTPHKSIKRGAFPMKAGKRPDFSKISFEERFAIGGYSYKVMEAAKYERQIQLVPKTRGRIQQVRLNVLPGGHSTLTIGTTDYQPITYAGNLEAVKLKKKRR